MLLHRSLGTLPPEERDAHIERDRLPIRNLARFGIAADHHLGELAGKVVLLFLGHGVRIATATFARLGLGVAAFVTIDIDIVILL